MPIIDFIELSDGRGVLISTFYSQTVGEYMLECPAFLDEELIISVLLCGISSIYSFALQGYAHCNIKMNNIMAEGSRIFSLILDLQQSLAIICQQQHLEFTLIIIRQLYVMI